MPRPASSRRPRWSPALLGAAALASVLTGCGHPATREECEELFTKNAEIELRAQHVSDPKQIAERTSAARAAEGEAFTHRCMGKRITARALACVRQATTAEQLDRCL
jgi:hypothetical protein